MCCIPPSCLTSLVLTLCGFCHLFFGWSGIWIWACASPCLFQNKLVVVLLSYQGRWWFDPPARGTIDTFWTIFSAIRRLEGFSNRILVASFGISVLFGYPVLHSLFDLFYFSRECSTGHFGCTNFHPWFCHPAFYSGPGSIWDPMNFFRRVCCCFFSTIPFLVQ